MTSRRRWPLVEVLAIVAAAGAVLVALAVLLTPGPSPRASATPTPNVAAPTSELPVPTSPPEPSTTAPTPGIAGLADPAWVARVSAAAGIPERAMAAYAGATIAIAQTHPDCGLGWNTLAAIGEVETHHGTYGGATIGADGVASPTIIGIPLDGNGTLAIRDTDGGALDGDTTWDRAVGPMQFIPSTWAAHGTDGNGDGVADINQIDDAVLSAAGYLCGTGGDLRVEANWIRAVAAYNPSLDYNHKVAAAAEGYALVN